MTFLGSDKDNKRILDGIFGIKGSYLYRKAKGNLWLIFYLPDGVATITEYPVPLDRRNFSTKETPYADTRYSFVIEYNIPQEGIDPNEVVVQKGADNIIVNQLQQEIRAIKLERNKLQRQVQDLTQKKEELETPSQQGKKCSTCGTFNTLADLRAKANFCKNETCKADLQGL